MKNLNYKTSHVNSVYSKRTEDFDAMILEISNYEINFSSFHPKFRNLNLEKYLACFSSIIFKRKLEFNVWFIDE